MVEKVDGIMSNLVERGHLAGGVVMINRRGRTIHFEAYGQSDLASKAPMRTDTLFRIYSMTKAVTSAAALMLVEEGRLDLDAPVADYFPAFADQKVLGKTANDGKPERPVLVRDLMRHTSGIGYGWPEKGKMYKLLDWGQSTESLVSRAARMPLAFEPGSDWLYGVNTDLVGALIERQSGQTLRSFLRQRIFKPLGMTDTDFAGVSPNRMATLYKLKDGTLTPDKDPKKLFFKVPVFQSGGGGLVSSARDYMRFLQMIAHDGRVGDVQLLKPETVRLMIRNDLPEAAMPVAFGAQERHGLGFGLGFNVKVAAADWDPAAPVGEVGWGGMASTHYWIHPAKELVVITLEQVVPYSFSTEWAVKDTIYKALQN